MSEPIYCDYDAAAPELAAAYSAAIKRRAPMTRWIRTITFNDGQTIDSAPITYEDDQVPEAHIKDIMHDLDFGSLAIHTSDGYAIVRTPAIKMIRWHPHTES